MGLQLPIGSIASRTVGSDEVLIVQTLPDFELIDSLSAVAGWTAFGNDTTGLAVDNDHVWGTKSLEFDKVDGAAGSAVAGASKTITSVDISRLGPHCYVTGYIKVSATTDIANAFIRLGTDSSNYATFSIADTDITGAAWQEIKVAWAAGVTTGTGCDPSAITYIAVGVTFDAEDDTLADIRFDRITVRSAIESD